MDYETSLPTAELVPAALRPDFESLSADSQKRTTAIIAISPASSSALIELMPVVDSILPEDQRQEPIIGSIVAEFIDEVLEAKSGTPLDDFDNALVHGVAEKVVQVFDAIPEEHQGVINFITSEVVSSAFSRTTPHEDELHGTTVNERMRQIIDSEEYPADIAATIVRMLNEPGAGADTTAGDDLYEQAERQKHMDEVLAEEDHDAEDHEQGASSSDFTF